MSLNTRQKLTLFAGCFSGLPNVYGTYDPITNFVWTAKYPVTPDVMQAHLQGRKPYGVFLLTGSVTRAVVADFDHEDREPLIAYHSEARRYGLAVYIERSKRKGWHAWIFAPPQGVSAHKARSVVKMILTDIGCPNTEVFPKQDCLEGPDNYGNFINAPLFGKLVPQGRTVFVDLEADFQPYADQWDLLASVVRATESQLDGIFARNNLWSSAEPTQSLVVPDTQIRIPGAFGLPPCAQHMLRKGVTANQRLACFRLAVHLKKAGLPENMTVAVLNLWAPKNRPEDGKRILTPKEIAAQTHAAYTKQYRGCGCDNPAVLPFCSETCPLYSRVRRTVPATPSSPSASPASSTPPPSTLPAPARTTAH